MKNNVLSMFFLRVLVFGLIVVNSSFAKSPNVIGFWYKSDSTYRFKFEAKFDLSESIDGYFEWTLLDSPRESERIGATAKEYVRGSFDPETRHLLLKGYKKDDPFRIISLDEYRLEVSEDGGYIFGSTKGGGDWDGRIESRPKQVNGLEKNRESLLAKERRRENGERRETATNERQEGSCGLISARNLEKFYLGMGAGEVGLEKIDENIANLRKIVKTGFDADGHKYNSAERSDCGIQLKDTLSFREEKFRKTKSPSTAIAATSNAGRKFSRGDFVYFGYRGFKYGGYVEDVSGGRYKIQVDGQCVKSNNGDTNCWRSEYSGDTFWSEGNALVKSIDELR